MFADDPVALSRSIGCNNYVWPKAMAKRPRQRWRRSKRATSSSTSGVPECWDACTLSCALAAPLPLNVTSTITCSTSRPSLLRPSIYGRWANMNPSTTTPPRFQPGLAQRLNTGSYLDQRLHPVKAGALLRYDTATTWQHSPSVRCWQHSGGTSIRRRSSPNSAPVRTDALGRQHLRPASRPWSRPVRSYWSWKERGSTSSAY